MIHPPAYAYCGLTIVLDKPSRHDRKYLISGYAGNYFNSCLQPIDRFQTEIRLAANQQPLLTNTKVALLLGEAALHTVRPGANLLHLRGSPIISNDIVYIPTLAPQDAYDHKNYESEEEDETDAETESEKDYQKTHRRNFRFWLRKDTQKAVRILREGLRVHPNYNVITYPGPEIVEKILLNAENKIIVVDIETDRYRNITCFAFTVYDTVNPLDINIYVVPIKRYNNSLAYQLLDCAKIFRALTIAFSRNLIVVHNGGGFDFIVLAYKYLVNLPPNSWDTMLAQHRIYPEVEKSLGHLITLYTDLPYHKDEGIFEPKNPKDEAQLWGYCAKDVYGTLLIYLGQQKELTKQGVRDSIAQANKSIRPYATMSIGGAKVDTACLLKTYDSYANRSDQMRRLLTLMVGQPLNPRSWQQVEKYLYTYLGLPKPDKDPTNELNLTKLYIKYGIPSIRLILEARGSGKMASSLKFKLWRNDRFTCSWKIGKTDTFRLGSSALFKFKGEKGFGSNFQNWNKKLRPCIIADDGMEMGQTDQAGAEAKVVAYLCPDGRFRQLFTNGIKPHTYVAMHLTPERWAKKLGLPDIDSYLNCAIPELKHQKYWKDLAKLIADSDDEPNGSDRIYYIGKQACHQLNYDATWMMFQLSCLLKSEGSLRLTSEEAKRIRNLYRDTIFPEIYGFHDDVQKGLESNGRILYNLFGYPRYFGDFWGRELFKKAYAFIPQSTVGSITNIAITELSDKLYNKDPLLTEAKFMILANGHDSILWQCLEGFGRQVAPIVKSHLEKTMISPRGESFTMGSETQLGYNWGVKSDKNPRGLEKINI